jgi:hypothetical protein
MYHERCISIMLPVLDKSESEIGIDLLISSTVMLRFFEQVSCMYHPHPYPPPTELTKGQHATPRTTTNATS